jgi:hypothetical protein
VDPAWKELCKVPEGESPVVEGVARVVEKKKRKPRAKKGEAAVAVEKGETMVLAEKEVAATTATKRKTAPPKGRAAKKPKGEEDKENEDITMVMDDALDACIN